VPEPSDARNHPHPDPLPEYRERGQERWTRASVISLIVILLIAAAVRFHGLTRHPLWLDEFFSLQHSAGRGADRLSLATSGVRTPPPDLVGLHSRAPYPQIWRGMASQNNDVHPPLFQIVLRLWRDALDPIVGETDAMLRTLAVLFGVASVGLMFDVVRLLHGTRPAAWAALIMALATPQLHWAQDTRPYTMMFVLVLGAIDAVIRLERHGPGAWRTVALACCTFAAGLTHYYSLPALAALGLYALVRLRGAARMQAGAALLGAVALFAALWGPSLLVQLRGAVNQAAFLRDDAPGHLMRSLTRVALLPQQSLNEPSPQIAAIACLGAVLYVIPLLMHRRRPDLLLWAFWMAGGIVLPLYMDVRHQWKQLEYLRYGSVVMLAFYPLIATLLDRAGRSWMRHVLPAIAVVSCLVSLPRAYAETETPKPDYPYLAQALRDHVQPGDAIVFYRPADAGYPLLWYMGLSWYARDAMPQTAVFIMGPPDAQARAALRDARTLWSVADPGQELPAGVTDGRVPGPQTSGFNLPVLRAWPRPPSASVPTTGP
jgi:hypothetical protein